MPKRKALSQGWPQNKTRTPRHVQVTYGEMMDVINVHTPLRGDRDRRAVQVTHNKVVYKYADAVNFWIVGIVVFGLLFWLAILALALVLCHKKKTKGKIKFGNTKFTSIVEKVEVTDVQTPPTYNECYQEPATYYQEVVDELKQPEDNDKMVVHREYSITDTVRLASFTDDEEAVLQPELQQELEHNPEPEFEQELEQEPGHHVESEAERESLPMEGAYLEQLAQPVVENQPEPEYETTVQDAYEMQEVVIFDEQPPNFAPPTPPIKIVKEYDTQSAVMKFIEEKPEWESMDIQLRIDPSGKHDPVIARKEHPPQTKRSTIRTTYDENGNLIKQTRT